MATDQLVTISDSAKSFVTNAECQTPIVHPWTDRHVSRNSSLDFRKILL